MSGLMDKAKDAMGKGSSGGDSSQGGSGIEKGADNAVNQRKLSLRSYVWKTIMKY